MHIYMYMWVCIYWILFPFPVVVFSLFVCQLRNRTVSLLTNQTVCCVCVVCGVCKCCVIYIISGLLSLFTKMLSGLVSRLIKVFLLKFRIL